jgi:hypothetical protein
VADRCCCCCRSPPSLSSWSSSFVVIDDDVGHDVVDMEEEDDGVVVVVVVVFGIPICFVLVCLYRFVDCLEKTTLCTVADLFVWVLDVMVILC